MRHLRPLLALAAAALLLQPLVAQQNRASPHETVSTVLGDRHNGNRITVVYGRPYTKSPKTGQVRTIWGGLVPWDEPYRLGADEATLFVTQQPIVVGESPIPAGAYTLYMVPSKDGTSRLAFSSSLGKWGEPVDTAHDVARADLKRADLDTPVDQLTIAVEKDGDRGGMLRISWEKTAFTLQLHPASGPVEFPQASPVSTLRQRIGLTDVQVVYSRPSSKGRTMLGGINPYGEVWRTGANNATRIMFSSAVTLQGTPVAAGTYELFSIPEKDEWTIILQKATDQWGAYAYDPKNDVARVKAKPAQLSEPVETFQIEFGNLRDDSATMSLVWETTRVDLKLGVDVTSVVVPQIDAVMAGSGKKPYLQAALFYLDHNLDLTKAKAWIEAAIAADPNGFYLYYHKARILARLGDKEGAQAAAKKSIEAASAAPAAERDEYTRLNEALIASLK